MPILKTKIFNSEIDLNFEESDKEKLIELINKLNSRFSNYKDLNGKVSDIKIVILAALAIEDELIEQKKILNKEKIISKKLDYDKSQIEKLSLEIVKLKDKIFLLESQITDKQDAFSLIEKEIEKIDDQLQKLNTSMTSIYEK